MILAIGFVLQCQTLSLDKHPPWCVALCISELGFPQERQPKNRSIAEDTLVFMLFLQKQNFIF